MIDGAWRVIGHKITANTVMYPGSGPSGEEVKPLRPASLCIYQWSSRATMVLLELHVEWRKKPCLACSTREITNGQRIREIQ